MYIHGSVGECEWVSFDEMARRKGADVALEYAETEFYPMQKVEGLKANTRVQHKVMEAYVEVLSRSHYESVCQK